MSFLGPGFEFKPGWKPKPRWRQRWWWRERTPTIVAAVVLAVLVGLAAWLPFYLNDKHHGGGGMVPSQTVKPGKTVVPTGTRPHEEPPKLPDAVSEPNAAGVEATVRYSFDAANYAQRTGDVEPLKRVYDLEHCAVCEGFLRGIENYTKDGRYLQGAAYTVNSVTAISVRVSGDGEYRGTGEARIERGAGRQLGPDGRFVRETAASPPHVSELRLAFDNGGWRIYASSPKEQR